MSAQALKQQGNEAFSKGEYDLALKCFTDAIALNPEGVHLFYSNRSATLASMGRFEEALADAKKTVELVPTFAKGFARMATALIYLRRFDEAQKAIDSGLKIDPENESLKQCIASMEEQRPGMQVEETPAAAGLKKIGDAAAPLVGLTYIKKGPVQLEKNKVTIVEFWATWCPPWSYHLSLNLPRVLILALSSLPHSRRSIPHLTELARRYPQVQIVGVSDEDEATVRPFVEQQGDQMDYPVAIDPRGQVHADYFHAFGQEGIPCAFIVGKDGKHAWVGNPMGGLTEALQAAVAAPDHPAPSAAWGSLFDGVWTKIATNPQLAPLLANPEFVKKVTEISQDPAKLAKSVSPPCLSPSSLRPWLAMAHTHSFRSLPVILDRMALPLLAHIADANVQLLMSTLSGAAAPKPAEKPRATPAPAPSPAPRPASKPAQHVRKEPPPELSEEEREKFIGNEDFAERKFTEALAHYNRALEINPNNITLYSNKGACELELACQAQASEEERTAHLDACVALCEKAIEMGRAQYADFKLMAKIFLRLGNCRHRQGKYAEALEAYDHSLTENRMPEVVRKRAEVEKEWKEAQRRAYLDPAKAEEERVKGNAFFQEGKFPEAVAAYTESLARNPEDPRVYSNRAACFIKLMRWYEALADCDEALKRDPKFIRAYSRKAQVQTFLKQYPQAMKTYDQALAIDPANQDLLESRDHLMQTVMEKQSSGQVDEEQIREAAKDPEIRALMQDPTIANVLQEMQRDPVGAQKFLKDPKIMGAINKLAVAGVLRVQRG
ncbi:putative Hsp70-Hsp90 organizing protein 2 [Paratrimastix pyriformis]|uniref:Hsp70-Hsp90 organizing protein 2 n=1 Tax=Paratrimastix pyriformis TaxID=342808 RepID=A0ABQ8U510_9EUKA|nr:putative Hsp70-Hsp90 organizing protein 2 [Paratrimastix pyriformis]